MDKMTHTKFNLNNFLMAFSEPLDRTIKSNIYGIEYSSKRVAYIALRIASIYKLVPEDISDIFSYAIVCKNNITQNSLETFPFNCDNILQKEKIVSIVEFALKIENNINIQNNIIVNKDKIIEDFTNNDIRVLFDEVSFWYDLTSTSQLPFFIFSHLSDFTMELSFDRLIILSKTINNIVYDYTNRNYDNQIDEKAKLVTKYYQFDEKDSSRFIIASLLSNIGYLHIPKELIEKKDKLTKAELEIFQSVPYHTKNILTQVFGFDDIAQLGGYVYERLDGSGYPYKIKSNNLSLKNRILSILVIYQALQEDRSYRTKYNTMEMKDILDNMVLDNHLDGTILKDILGIFITH